MSINNKVLQSAIDGVEQRLTPQNRQAYDRIVTAGMQAALHRGIDGMMAGIKKYPDPIQACAAGAVNLVLMLRAHATGYMPPAAMVPASYTLMCQALAFTEEAGITKIDQNALKMATQMWTNTVFTRVGVTPAKLRQGAEQVHGILNDPAKVEIINRQTGYAKDPRASTPLQEAAPEPPPMNRRERRKARRAKKRWAKGEANVAA